MFFHLISDDTERPIAFPEQNNCTDRQKAFKEFDFLSLSAQIEAKNLRTSVDKSITFV